MIRRGAATALLVLVIASGCSSQVAPTPLPPTPTPDPAVVTPSPEPTTTRSPGGREGRLAFEDERFAITLAPGWVEAPLDADAVPAFLESLPDELTLDPSFGEDIDGLVEDGLRVWAFDVSPSTMTAGSFGSVHVTVSDQGVPAGLLLDRATRELGGTIDPEARVSDASVGDRDGVRVDLVISNDEEQGPVLATFVWVSSATRLYRIAFFTGQRDLPMQQSIDGMIVTFEILD